MGEVKCSFCKKVFLRPMKRIYEAEMHGWKQYCSLDCQSKARTKAKEFKCGNPQCNKAFFRSPHEVSVSGICFCSNSCSAKVNNKIRELKRQKKHCRNSQCGKVIPHSNKYCSNRCQMIVNKIPDEEYKLIIIERIKLFYRNNQRIPVKREMWTPKIHRVFKSWNKAIIAAGFKPNPVMFADKHVANDGHKCDSLAEKIIDDWLFSRHISHETKVPYGKNRMTADFKIGSTYVEFFGLKGAVDKYDKNVFEKEQLWKEKNLKVISIYPKDLFPMNKLSEILSHRSFS